MLPLEAQTNDPAATKPGDGAEEAARQTMAERRLVRKVDMLLMPVLLCSAGLQYYDSASARILCSRSADELTSSSLTLPLRRSLCSCRGCARFCGHLWHHQGSRAVDDAHRPRDGQGRRLDAAVLDCLVRILCALLSSHHGSFLQQGLC